MREPMNRGGGPRWALHCALVVGAAGLLVVGGCSDPLGVETPDVVDPDDLGSEEGLAAQRVGAFGDFALAYGGSAQETAVQGIVTTTGLLTDEIVHSGTQNGRVQMDARRADDRNERTVETYQNLHRARRSAESAAASYEAASDAADRRRALAELYALAGFAEVFFGESFCSGVPMGGLEGGEPANGEPLATEEIFERALGHFDEALSHAQAADDSQLESLASVGAGRALLNLGDFDLAADTVDGVETGFEYAINYSSNSNRQVNGVFSAIQEFGRLSVVDAEGANGIGYLEAHDQGDPRTPWEDGGSGFDSSVDLLLQLKYTDRASPIVLADGVEARLVDAEAALRAGETGTFEQIHNDLRARLDSEDVGAIDADTMSAQERVDFHFRERALWLWLTGHRLGDMRRLVRQYDRDAESVYPSGSYFKPQFSTYGDALTLIVPFEERNNPNFDGCLDTGA